ncbi:MAG: hypothetical protein LKF61_04645 [Eggerthellaceae bacterium]|nr:hypothetical protein [Eggerthellaceae bacterium]
MNTYKVQNISKKIIAVAISLCMLTIGMPIQSANALTPANSSSSAQSAADTTSQSSTETAGAASTGTSVSTNGTINAELSIDHASLGVDGQTIASGSTTLAVSAKTTLAFTAQADDGYAITRVYYTHEGSKITLDANAKGEYTIPSASVVSGINITVETEQQAATDSQAAVSLAAVGATASAQSVAGYSFTGETGSENLSSILGNGRYFGINAVMWIQAEAETNAAVKTLKASAQTGSDLTNDANQPWFIGEVDGSFNLKGVDADVYTPSENKDKINASGNKVNFHFSSKDDVDAYIDAILNQGANTSAAMAGRNSVVGSLPTPNTDGSDRAHMTTNYELDFTSNKPGTYYINLDSIYSSLNDGGLKIKKNANQTIVFNLTSESVNLKKFNVEQDGASYGSDVGNGKLDGIASTLVWNMPNATTVDAVGSVTGIFLAPKATFKISSTCSGWLLANKVVSGAGEWHNIWQHVDNAYAKIGINAKKVLKNATLTDKQFSFDLKDASGKTVQTAENKDDGSVAFEKITYTDPGTYAYTISEVIPDGATENSDGTYTKDGITYDKTTHTATVTVTKNKSNGLDVATTYDDNSQTAPIFTNTAQGSTPGSVTLNAKKVLKNATLTDKQFSFELKDASGKTVQTAENKDDGSVAFEEITYTDPGTYAYTISEVIPDGATENSDGTYTKDGITYDKTTHTATVTVTKNKSNGLDVATTYDDNSQTAPIFTNTAQGSASFNASKTLKGAVLKDDQFSFQLINADKDSSDFNKQLQVATSKADGSISFAPISYSKAGTYTYTISEVIPDGATENSDGTYIKDGITYDNKKICARVNVKDENGSLTTEVTYNGGKKTPGFANTYKASGTTAQFSAKKLFQHASLKSGEFSFRLIDASDNVLQTRMNVADGSINFDPIEYTEAGTYTYQIAEVLPSGVDSDHATNNGITYDTVARNVKVVVTDDNGQLHATTTYDGSDQTPTFTNSKYEATAQIAFDKHFYGADANKAFTFKLTATDASYTPRSDQSGDSVSSDVNKSIVDNGQAFTVAVQNGAFTNNTAHVALPSITYHQAGDYYYTLQEAKGSDGVTSDDTVYRIHVEVTTTPDGAAQSKVTTLVWDEAAASYVETKGMNFYNNGHVGLSFKSMSYATELDQASSADVMPVVKKELKNGTLQNGEFSFNLAKEDGTQIATGTNDAEGNVSFKDSGENADGALLKFYKAGTYTYTITENQGSDAAIKYDDQPITMTVVVSENSDGSLTAKPTYTKDGNESSEAQFSNQVKKVNIRVQKTSKSESGEALQNAFYGLWMVNDGGNDVYMGNAKSDSNGYIVFTDVPLQVGSQYYFKEESAPEGHLVDPYKSPSFTFVHDGSGFKIVYGGEN